MKKTKRLISILLSLAMTLMLLPTVAFAEDTASTVPLDENGLPTAKSGEGWMYNVADHKTLTLLSGYTFDFGTQTVNCNVLNYGTITSGLFSRAVVNGWKHGDGWGVVTGGMFANSVNQCADYKVCVNHGTFTDTTWSSAYLVRGTTVSVTADDAEIGYVFDHWTVAGSDVSFDDETATTTTFTMPGGSIGVKANYELCDHANSTTQPTCTEDAICSICGGTIKAVGHHDYEETVIPPTCTEEGYTVFTCKKCGDSYQDIIVPALGHQWGEWVDTKDNHTHERTCSVCGEVETEAHDWVDGVCSVCGAVLEKDSQYIDVNASSYKKVVGDKSFNLGAKTDGDGALTYKSSNTKAATVSSTGTVTVKGVGTATITITAAATDNCEKATKNVTVRVYPKTTTVTSVNNFAPKSLSVRWKQVSGVDGYQIHYYTSRNKNTVKTAWATSPSQVQKTIRNLQKNTWYYVHVRTYKTVGSKTYYSAWSNVKADKIVK